MILDLDHYCWRERAFDEDGDERLLVPHSDPDLYEFPIDFIFPTVDAALAWKAEAIDEEWVDHLEANAWVLVHMMGTIIPNSK